MNGFADSFFKLLKSSVNSLCEIENCTVKSISLIASRKSRAEDKPLRDSTLGKVKLREGTRNTNNTEMVQ